MSSPMVAKPRKRWLRRLFKVALYTFVGVGVAIVILPSPRTAAEPICTGGTEHAATASAVPATTADALTSLPSTALSLLTIQAGRRVPSG